MYKNNNYLSQNLNSRTLNTHATTVVDTLEVGASRIKNPGKKAMIILYCLPYAGGDVSIFRNWQQQLPSFIEVCPIRLPGRGSRIATPALTEISTLAIEIAKEIRNNSSPLTPTLHSTRPYALFGHSMGALLAFEITQILQSLTGSRPLHLFTSGCAAPHVRHKQRAICQLSDAEFISEVQQLNGTPPEFFEHSELVSLLLPMLRADFQACETYSYKHQEMLQVDITALGGKEDSDINMSQLNAWRDLTSGQFRLDTLSGDHFFLHQYERDVLNIVSTQLQAALNIENNSAVHKYFPINK